MRIAIAIAIVFIAVLAPSIHAADRLAVAREFLEENRLSRQEIVIPENYDILRKQIVATRDPETKFGPFIFALARHGEKYLSADQLRKVDALIASRAESPVNWHDVRNIVRVQALIALWAYAHETDAAGSARLKSAWEDWADLRLAYMFQEFVATERFQRAFWNICTAEQRKNIRSGEWDRLIKKNTGHGRLFSADKQLRRALGAPDDEAAFDAAAEQWRAKWNPVLEKYQAAAAFERRRAFAMDAANEAFALAAWHEYAEAFRAFAEGERDAIRDLLHAGYAINAATKKKISALQKELREQTIEKYEAHGAEFLRQLGEIK